MNSLNPFTKVRNFFQTVLCNKPNLLSFGSLKHYYNISIALMVCIEYTRSVHGDILSALNINCYVENINYIIHPLTCGIGK